MNNDLISRSELKKAIEELAITEEPVDYDCGIGTMTGVSEYLDRPDVLDLIDSAPTVNPFSPISEEVYYKITDAEYEHSDSFWITTPRGKKIEFEKKRPQGEWIIIDDVYCGCPFCKNKEVKFSKYCPECGAILKSVEKST